MAEGCGHEPLQWREVVADGDQVRQLAEAIQPAQPAAAGLARLAEVAAHQSPERLQALCSRHRQLREFAERRAAALLNAWSALREIVLPDGHDLASGREELWRRYADTHELAYGADVLLASCDQWRRQYASAYAGWHAEQHATARFATYDECRSGWRLRLLGNFSRLALDHAVSAVAVGEAVLTERRKQCRRADLTLALREALVCPDCGLLLGEPVRLRPVADLQAEAEEAIAERLRAVQSPAYRVELERGLSERPADDPRAAAVRQLLAWHDPPDERLLGLTSFAVIDLLNRLLTSPVVGHRSTQALSSKLAGHRLTKRQLHERFEQWLDPDERLEDDDLLQIDD